MAIVETVLADCWLVSYRRFSSGDPRRNLASRYRMYDLSQCVAQVDRILTESG